MTGSTKTARKRVNQEKVENLKAFKLPSFQPKTENQKELYFKALHNPLTIATGPAGTGKSYVGAYVACRLLIEKKIDQIILTRNPLPTGTSLGFFAGSETEKMAVWLGPVIGTLKKILKTETCTGDGFFNYLVEQKKIVYQPLETIKGSSFDNTFIIVEEAQELSFEQLKALTTRIGENSGLFLNGDYRQYNTRNREAIALKSLVEVIKKDAEYLALGYELDEWESLEIPVVEFSSSDIVRSDITRKMVKLLETMET